MSELKPDLSSFGYADGGYMSKCSHCKETFIGAKRAWSCEPCATEKSLKPKITRAVPDVPELVRYDWCRTRMMVEGGRGEYVRYDQAAEIIAAKDKEIERLKNLIDGDDCPDPDKIDALFSRAEAAEAKLAQYEAQEPVAYTLIFRRSYGVNTETTFKKFEDAEKYAIRCELPLSNIIPLYASPAPDADMKAKCDRYEQALDRISKMDRSHGSWETIAYDATNIAGASLNVEASNDKG